MHQEHFQHKVALQVLTQIRFKPYDLPPSFDNALTNLLLSENTINMESRNTGILKNHLFQIGMLLHFKQLWFDEILLNLCFTAVQYCDKIQHYIYRLHGFLEK